MNWVVALPSAVASTVEFVEAFTIVLAVGVTRGWKSAWAGTGAATAVLAVLVLVLGVGLLQTVPIDVLRTAVGLFLLLFGLKWLRKAIMRYTGLKALHDEEETFREEIEALAGDGATGSGVDKVAALTAFNGVLLEGLEVVFIVIALGAGARAIGSAAVGAALAGLAVVVAGWSIRHPLARVPENTLKFVVGVMLTAFGTFWTAEGIGVHWWRADLSLLPLTAGYLVISWLLISWLRTTPKARASVLAPGRAS